MLPFLLSFVSPLGRCTRWSFLWRQLLLAVLLFPSTYYACFHGRLMFGDNEVISWAGMLPTLLAQTFPPTLLSPAIAEAAASFNYMSMEEREFFYNYTPTGFELLPGIPALLCYMLALLAGWSSFALMLRRLRDTRFGYWPLPLCLTACWVAPVLAWGHKPVSDLQVAIICIPLLVSSFCASGRSR